MQRTLGARAILCGTLASTVGAVLGWAPPARAEHAPLSLTWEAPPECPGAHEVLGRVEQILRDTQASTTVDVTAKTAKTTDGRFEVALTVRTGGVAETKTMVASTCGALAEASAVIIALAIHPSGAAPADEDVPPPAAAAPPPPPPPPASAADKPRAAESPRSSPDKTKPFEIALGLGPSFSIAMLPEASAGFVVSAGLRVDRLRVGLLGTLSARQHPRFDKSAGASVDEFEGGVFAAYLVPLGPLALGPAANVEATYVRVEGFGIQDPQSASSVWPTFVLGARLEAALGRHFGLFARADALLSPTAPPITLAAQTAPVTLHDPPPVAPRLSFGAEIVLP